ncbi:hypothetical protein quinque_008648 [Culex quinquefasciatus]
MSLKNLLQSVRSPAISNYVTQSSRFHTSAVYNEIRKLARLRVVDNSDIGKRAMAEGKPPKCIHVYNKQMVAKGWAISNNVVLIDDNGTPLGTRIHVPIPTILRTILKEKTQAKGADYTKLLGIASRFV